MVNWQTEVEELHDVFEAYFLGTLNSLDRVDVALAPDFTIVSPDGAESSRSDTMQALRAGHGHTTSLAITVTEPVLLLEESDTVIGRYVENHALKDRTNHRISTVVFSRDDGAPNGLLWRRVHETWMA
jgi:hypothetical protein